MTPEEFGRVFVEHVQGWLRATQEADAAEDNAREEIRAQGYRLVTGGQVGPWVDGKTREEWTDAETGEVLFSGDVTQAFEGWQSEWAHVDRVSENVELPFFAVNESLPEPVRDFLDGLVDPLTNLGAAGLRSLLCNITG
jgi:hypothetical protein